MKNWKTVLYIFLQWTWAAPQTLLGLLLFWQNRQASHEIYHGAMRTRWKRRDGISLGWFIFTPDSEEVWCRQMAAHEYGHTFQSLWLGPFYLLAVGLPSVLWERLGVCRRLRAEKNVPYSAFYTERWADGLGERKLTALGGCGHEGAEPGYQRKDI